MAQTRWPEGLDAEVDVAHQRAMWHIERAGWGVMLLVLVAAFAGLWSHGPLAKGQAGSTATVALEYEHLARYQAPTVLRFRVREPQGDTVTFWVDRAYMDTLEIERIVPEPDRVEVAGDRLIYHFAARPGSALVTFQVRNDRYGWVPGAFGAADGPPHRFDTFVYP